MVTIKNIINVPVKTGLNENRIYLYMIENKDKLRNKGILKKDVQTPNGMLYKGTKVHVREEKIEHYIIQVSDSAGRLFWIKASDITV